MLLAPADVDLPRTIDATAGLVHDFLVYKMHNEFATSLVALLGFGLVDRSGGWPKAVLGPSLRGQKERWGGLAAAMCFSWERPLLWGQEGCGWFGKFLTVLGPRAKISLLSEP